MVLYRNFVVSTVFFSFVYLVAKATLKVNNNNNKSLKKSIESYIKKFVLVKLTQKNRDKSQIKEGWNLDE